MKKMMFATVIVSFLLALTAACTGDSAPSGNQAPINQPAANQAGNSTANQAGNTAHKTDDDVPAAVKAVFADAQQITTQHKDVPPNAVGEIEKETGGKVPDRDHHSYLAFATKDGKRTQLGAATLVKADGKDIVIVYESKNGLPYIKEVRAEGVPEAFLSQFVGKGHDDKFQIGGDLKANGVDEATAKAIALAVRIDAVTMQTLYGAAHTH